MLIDRIDVFDEDRHPDAVAVPVVEPMNGWKAALVATALAVLAREDLALAGAHAPKVGGLPQSQPFFHPSFSNQAKLC